MVDLSSNKTETIHLNDYVVDESLGKRPCEISRIDTKILNLKYIWLDKNKKYREKTRCFYNIYALNYKEYITNWNFDGSSTGQMVDEINTEIVLVPKKIFDYPFIVDENINKLVLCETYFYDKNNKLKPTKCNTRYYANEIFNIYKENDCWFGLEQEYVICDKLNNSIGFLTQNIPLTQGEYYCSTNNNGYIIMEEHFQLCQKAKIKIAGINAEVACGQFEFQIGICKGIESGDHLIMARYILEKLCEKYNFIVNYDPKPMGENWNGSGCHINYSDIETRNEKNGLLNIYTKIEKLKYRHFEHMKVYGVDNEKRLTGKHETSSFNTCTYGIGDRKASIRIPTETVLKKYGYFEDRRPAANIDPYLATSMLCKTCCENPILLLVN